MPGSPVTSRPDLAGLERVARDVAADWGLSLGPAFPGARYSYVAAAGEGAVLKVTPSEDDESDEEADALELWSGDGAVRLLRRDRERRALLLERVTPGTELAALAQRDEECATAIAVGVAERLWRRAGRPFRRLSDHVPRWLARPSGAPGAELLPLARTLYETLGAGRETLVHGDLHHHNLLAGDSGYVAIDPKPMLGEPEYDVASFLWNPLSYRMRLDVTERRIAAFAAAGLDEERIRAWAVIRGAYLGADATETRVLRALV